MTRKTNQKGFTLIELLITVAIVAILATIALPAYNQYKDRALFNEVVHSVEPAKTAVDVCVQTRGSGECAASTLATNWTATAFPGTDEGSCTLGATISVNGSGTWLITSTAADTGACPEWVTAEAPGSTFIIEGTASGDSMNWEENPTANQGTCVGNGLC